MSELSGELFSDDYYFYMRMKELRMHISTLYPSAQLLSDKNSSLEPEYFYYCCLASHQLFLHRVRNEYCVSVAGWKPLRSPSLLFYRPTKVFGSTDFNEAVISYKAYLFELVHTYGH